MPFMFLVCIYELNGGDIMPVHDAIPAKSSPVRGDELSFGTQPRNTGGFERFYCEPFPIVLANKGTLKKGNSMIIHGVVPDGVAGDEVPGTFPREYYARLPREGRARNAGSSSPCERQPIDAMQGQQISNLMGELTQTKQQITDSRHLISVLPQTKDSEERQTVLL
jgi:hypothetical protein